MKKLLFAALLAATFTASAQQAVQPTNRYSMKLTQQADGSYELMNRARYARIVDLEQIDDLLVPYTYERQRLQSRDYKGVEVREPIYTTHEGYELQIAIDLAQSDEPTPVVFYVHGGGWSRGNNGTFRVLSQYMAKRAYASPIRSPRSQEPTYAFRPPTSRPPCSISATTPQN